MVEPDPDNSYTQRAEEQQRGKEEEDFFTHMDRRHDSFFKSLLDFPAAIYRRGNEHGREFGRMLDDRHQQSRDEREKQRSEWEDERHKKKQEWTYDEVQHQRNKEPDQQRRDEKMMDDWVGRVVRDLEGREEQAKDIYELWNRMGTDGIGLIEKEATKKITASDMQIKEKDLEQSNATWADIFPAWSSEAKQSEVPPGHEHIFAREEKTRRRPLSTAARGVEDTIDKLHQNFGRVLGDAEHWRQFIHKGFQRECRLWEDEGFFGPAVPFSRLLSTMFSMGLRPFLPNDSAMAYLLYSEYSPLHLEHEDGFDATFRDRFEDLLKVQYGKQLEEARGQKQSGMQVEWLGRIVPLLKGGDTESVNSITIGSTPEKQQVVQVEQHYEHSPPQGCSSEQRPSTEDPTSQAMDTEMALYEHLLDTSQPLQQRVASSLPGLQIQETVTPPTNISSILSSMTTTERHTAPDGSVTTKTVLKKRFADGTEESHETVETTLAASAAGDADTHGLSSWARQRIGDDRFHSAGQGVRERIDDWRHESKSESRVAKEAKASRGWFWSSRDA